MDFSAHGFVRVTAVAPPVVVADPAANAAAILRAYGEAAPDACVVLFPELAITGYTCEDLFLSDDLRQATLTALMEVAERSDHRCLVVGAPWWLADGRLLDCAFVCRDGGVLGAVPKVSRPNYEEFYEKRWFASGAGVAEEARLGQWMFPLDARLLFEVGEAGEPSAEAFRFGIEICEDLWAPKPPSADLALGGAEIVLNPSASTELVAKADYRRDLVRMQSARTISGYVYAGAGPTESTKDVVFGGHLLAAEDGHLLGQTERFRLEGVQLTVDIDCLRLRHARQRNATFAQAPRDAAAVRTVPTGALPALAAIERDYPKQPFVPSDEAEFDARAQDILAIQSTGLARRMMAARAERLVIGLSGGLDSTLAFLVCLDALAALRMDTERLVALTMPGPGTTPHTLESAKSLAAAAGVALKEVPIHDAVRGHLADLDHSGEADVTFENAQARERTQILFNKANQVNGIVVGTGDLSELALGWCTFNADHMAGYNVNAGVPKTLVAYLVRWYARHIASKPLGSVLRRVLDTPITPELVPAAPGDAVAQPTEAIIGPYELHDFFLYHFMRHGAGAAKILALATHAFQGERDEKEIRHWLAVFFRRFFAAQFKRTTLPPGPKVGTVSLSPRGDWRMPDEASVAAFLNDEEPTGGPNK
ncbi:MAG: NAD(+) synthase [Gammaproteobacteria bacterium]|nr:NAD(+) synthase [Gammaproteobacteria bacterium]